MARGSARFAAQLTLAVSGAFSPDARAQETKAPEDERLAATRRELQSEDPARLAWALHDAVEAGIAAGIRDELPDILQRLAAPVRARTRPKAREEQEARRYAVAWALDIAIRFGGSLADRELAPIASFSRLSEDAVLIVAARDPASCMQTLFELAGDHLPQDDVEFAACEVLAASAPTALLDHLLDHLPVELQVVAYDLDPPKPIEECASVGVG